MKPLRSYAVKVELDPTPAQRRVLAGRAADARQLWNKTLERSEIEYQIAKAAGEKVPYRRPDQILKAYPDAFFPGFPTAIVRPISEAYRRSLSTLKKGGRPRFKSRFDRWSFGFQVQSNARVASALPIPKGPLVAYKEDPMPRVHGRIVSAGVSRDVDRWWVSFTVIDAPMPSSAPRDLIVGVDVNTRVIACSDGRRFNIPPGLAVANERVKEVQRALSRCEKGSRRRAQVKLRLGKAYRKARWIRNNWLHNVSHELATTCSVIVFEDLRVRNMIASAAGTVDAPGTNVRAKAGLNRAILNASFSELRRQLEYKGAWYGCEIVCVNPAYTSRTCSQCSHVNEHKPAVYRTFVCEGCGHTQDRDDNAAHNIEIRGRESLGGRARSTSLDDSGEIGTQLPASADRASDRHPIPEAEERNARKTGDPPRLEDRAGSSGANNAPVGGQAPCG